MHYLARPLAFLFIGIFRWTVRPASATSRATSDVISMIQVTMDSRKDEDDSMNNPPWLESLADPTTTYFDDIPVFKHNRVHAGSMSPRNQWIIVYPNTYTRETLKTTCLLLTHPAMCDHVSKPEDGEFPFTLVHAYENELKSSRMYNVNGIKAKFIQLDGPTRMNKVGIPWDPFHPFQKSSQVPWGLDRIDGKIDKKYSPGIGQNGDVNTGGSDVIIYHFDTGVVSSLPEFTYDGQVHSEQYWDATSSCSSSEDTLDHQSRICTKRRAGTACSKECAKDNQGHGTHTAGTICGRNYGVAKGAKCRTMKVLNDQGTGAWSWFMEALNHVISSEVTKPAIVSASLGSPTKEEAVEEGINEAVNKGVVVVVAAGNEAKDACLSTPGYVKSAIVVGATQRGDDVSSYSNTGKCVDIFAPGSYIPSLDHTGQEMIASGTSMAAPHVAGAVALNLKSFDHNADWNCIVEQANTQTKGGVKFLTVGAPWTATGCKSTKYR